MDSTRTSRNDSTPTPPSTPRDRRERQRDARRSREAIGKLARGRGSLMINTGHGHSREPLLDETCKVR